MDVKLSSQRTCQNSVIKILSAVGAGIWGEGTCPPTPEWLSPQVSRCLPDPLSPPGFPEQQASWLQPGQCLSCFLKELSAPAGFPHRPGPVTCAHLRARGSQAACPLGRGFWGEGTALATGAGSRQDPVKRGLLWGGPSQGGRRENKQERGVRMRVACPELGWGSWGGTARPCDTQQQHWHFRAGGHSIPESSEIGRQFVSFHPQIKPP